MTNHFWPYWVESFCLDWEIGMAKKENLIREFKDSRNCTKDEFVSYAKEKGIWADSMGVLLED